MGIYNVQADFPNRVFKRYCGRALIFSQCIFPQSFNQNREIMLFVVGLSSYRNFTATF